MWYRLFSVYNIGKWTAVILYIYYSDLWIFILYSLFEALYLWCCN